MGFWLLDEQSLPEDIYDEADELRERLNQVQIECHKLRIDFSWSSGPHHDDYVAYFRRRMYPWMREVHRVRDDVLLADLNEQFASDLASTINGKTSCVVRRHAFGEDAGGIDTSDILGVFASRDICEGEIVLIDRTKCWGLKIASNGGDCVPLYGRCCLKHFGSAYGVCECEVDLSWVRKKVGNSEAAYAMLLYRLLHRCIEDGIEPLDHPLIAGLTPVYRNKKLVRFSYTNEIEISNKVLQEFGIDVFANHSYDTWVLFTIDARVENNSCSGGLAHSLHPLFSLFNHSCDPNVQWRFEDHETIKVTASRDIKKDEQLLVTYSTFAVGQSLHERRETMASWLDAPCQCTRCLIEEAEGYAMEREGKAEAGPAPTWNVGDSVMFPEDALEMGSWKGYTEGG